MDAYLGIDAGNTGVKAVLFDETGRELARAHRDTGGTSPAPGMVERDVEVLRSDLADLVVEVLAKGGVPGSAVKGVGTAGHGNGLYLLDAQGKALAAIQSLDTRAAGLVTQWDADGTSDAVNRLARQRPWASQTPTLMAWMAEHRPEVLQAAAHVLMCKDVVTHALTGEVVSDISDMGGAGLLNLPANCYDDDLLAAYGLSEYQRLLPRLLWPTEVAGHVTGEVARKTGLIEGTPVVAGLFDVVASAIGAGVTQIGQASTIIGTWSINQAIVAEPAAAVFMSCGVAPGRYMSMENSATSAANLEWVAHHLLGHDERRQARGAFALADELALAAPLRADGPFYHPYLYGAGTNPAARAGFMGLAGWHDTGDLMRALFEGVAFAHLAHINKMRAAGVDFGRITISGGGAKSPLWPQMLADMLDASVDVAAQPESGALGAAMAAAVGSGRFPDLDAAAAAMVAPATELRSDAQRSRLYQRRFALWQQIEQSMAPHWASLANLTDV
ncbi:carbohydrate kinase [Hoeflea sp. G2-23]|uniref:Carbohydrate kinase n=1 Tax=Hoeflea algicola TaxID=2983763 RepID=A0ABT3Z482_9HYPH|nr:FGGY-family carbohydrate kinase [Hoeflea algicola]MCY0146577.1 carbohydrate kinase [Hoeflea algicola]